MNPAPTTPAAADFAAATASLLPALARLADRDAVVLRLADTLACALGAEALADQSEGTVTRLRRLAAPAGSATLWATGEHADAEAAGFRNAVAARYLDYNDTYVGRAIVHPSDMVGALVALAEVEGVAWDRLIEAVSVAYDVLCRLADQAALRPHGVDGSTLTPLGAAAGAAWLLGLDERQSATALSIAALDAATLRAVRQGRLSDWKAIASPRGASKGVFAARMAAIGCIAPTGPFEGDEGFATRVAGPMVLDANGPSRLDRTILKAHPAQIFIQGLIGLAGDLHRQLGDDVAQVASVRVRTFRLAVELVGGHGHPAGRQMNRETADHSAAFAIAAVLATGRLGHEDYDRLLADTAVLDLMAKVALEEDPAATAAFPRDLPAALEVSLADGRTLEARQSGPEALGPGGLAQKFFALWPAAIPRGWRWSLPGEAPAFPVAAS